MRREGGEPQLLAEMGDGSAGLYARNTNPAAVAAALRGLPLELRTRLACLSSVADGSGGGGSGDDVASGMGEKTANSERNDWASALATSRNYPAAIMTGLTAIVGRSSKQQAVVGVLSAGLGKSVQYGSAKLGKMWEGMTN
jgi:hypothetical protein